MIIACSLKWKEKAGPPTPAVQTYLERIDMLSADNPHLLVAHAYTQHLAMLAGGQVLRWSVRCTMQIARGDPGTAIFEFKVPPTPPSHGTRGHLPRQEGSSLGVSKVAGVV